MAASCVALLLFMRTVGAVTGSRTIGTLAGLGVVTLPIILVVALGLVGLLAVFAVIGCMAAVPAGIYAVCRRLSR